jgi:hypothetical protein
VGNGEQSVFSLAETVTERSGFRWFDSVTSDMNTSGLSFGSLRKTKYLTMKQSNLTHA